MRPIDKTYDMAYVLSAKEIKMTTLTASEARASLYRLIDETTLNHQPVLIAGKRHNAVLRQLRARSWLRSLHKMSASTSRGWAR